MYAFGPSIIMLICSLAIIIKLSRAAAARKKLTSGVKDDAKVSATSIMLVVNALAFSFLTLPSVIFRLLPTPIFDLVALANGGPDTGGYYPYLLTLASLDMLININHSINFLLYCLSGRTFRNEFFAIFKRSKPVTGNN